MTAGRRNRGPCRLSVRLSVRSSQPEPFGPEAVVDDGPTRAQGARSSPLALTGVLHARGLPWPVTSHVWPSLVPCRLAN